MNARVTSSGRIWAAAGAVLLVAAALSAWIARQSTEPAPPDCSLTPSGHHTGTFLHWRLSMAPGEGMSGEVSAAVRLDDGHEVIAYNVTNAVGLSAGDKVSVSEIQCINRRVYLIQAGGG